APFQSKVKTRSLSHYDVFRSCIRFQRLARCPQESVHAGRADGNQAKREREAEIAKAAARPFPRRDAPLRREQPQSVAEVPGSGDDRDRVKGDHPRILEFCLNLGERLHGVRRQVHAGEAQIISMLHHVDERDDASPALGAVKPIALPRIIDDVGVALIPDVDAVEAVVKDRNPDKEQLQKKNSGQAIEKLDLLAVSLNAFEGFGVRDEMFEKEGSDGYDAGERMQTAQQERDSLASAQRSDAGLDSRSYSISG